MRQFVRIVLAAAAASTVASAQTSSRWSTISDARFEILTTAGEVTARRALEEMNRVNALLEPFIGARPAQLPRTRVIVFSSSKEFAPYASGAAVKAFYQSGPDRDVIAIATLSSAATPAVLHEYAHLLFRRTGRVYPTWLNEGLSEFFSTLAQKGSRVEVGRAPAERAEALGFGVRLLPLAQLFAVRPGDAIYVDPAGAKVFYAESWALAHMLMSDERYRFNTPMFLQKVGSGEPAERAAVMSFGRPLSDIEEDLKKFALRGRYRLWQHDLAALTDTPAAAARTISDFDANVALAAMIGHDERRRTDAADAFERLRRQQPDNLTLLEELALFHTHNGGNEEALAHFERAIALGSSNARIYSEYAEAVSDAGAKLSTAREAELFTRAMTLAPDDPIVRLHYARSLLRQARREDAAAVLLEITWMPVEYAAMFQDAKTAAGLKQLATPNERGRSGGIR